MTTRRRGSGERARLNLMAEAAQRIRGRGDYAETRGGKVSRKIIKAIRERSMSICFARTERSAIARRR
jgi:hypothetical protein